MADKDILLAAECKTSSEEEEEKIATSLKQQIKQNYRNGEGLSYFYFMGACEIKAWDFINEVFFAKGAMKKKNKHKLAAILGRMPKSISIEICFNLKKTSQQFIWLLQVLFRTHNFTANELLSIEQQVPIRQKSQFNHLCRMNNKYNRLLKKNSIISCKLTQIYKNRVFVKIENEARPASIYIGELANKRIENIFDFEYNGEKLHIGQKLVARVISIDSRLGRINLSLK
ncbi:MAG: hypothetical protein JNM36_17875 [Chitinophagales bacterium]|nr:hypothetical protein [Chitinophagales bacterium]